MIELWTDGSYSEHTNVGAWAYKINDENVIKTSNIVLENGNTSYRMELRAILKGLKGLKNLTNIKTSINVYSDCKGIVDILNNVREMESRNWRIAKVRKKNGELIPSRHIKDLDLFLGIAQLLKATSHKINFIWIKGHNESNKMTLNVKVDKMAQKARKDYEKYLYGF